MSSATLSDRALGRATLARQLLLERSDTAPLDAIADGERARLSAAPTPVKGTVLADGRGLGGWRLDRPRTTPSATMAIQTIVDVDRSTLGEVEAEAARLAAFMAPDAETGIHVTILA